MPVLIISVDYDGYVYYYVNAGTYGKNDTETRALFGYFHDKYAGTFRYRTFLRFPLSSLPANATVTKVRLRTATLLPPGGSAHLTDIHPYNGDGQADPQADNAQKVYARIGAGTPYVDDSTAYRTTGWKWFDLGAQACIDVENAKATVNRFVLGIHEEGDNDDFASIPTLEYGGGYEAILEITYEAPPALGYSYSDGLVFVQVRG